MLQSLIATSRTWTALPLRLALGLIFIVHGAQKVFGMWGGPGLTKFATASAPFDWMQPNWLWMGAAALAELVGGTLILLGLLTRVGAALVMPVMLVAMLGVHWEGGFFISNKPVPGIEFTVALLGSALALLISGGGRLSVDEMMIDPRARRR